MHPAQSSGVIGRGLPRIDGPAKVTGQALYGADQPAPDPAYACLVTATVACGRIHAIDEAAARVVPGLLDIMTHFTVGKAVRPGKLFNDGGYMATTVAPLGSDRVHFSGQVVAVVLAGTFEAARAAAAALCVDYDAEASSASFDSLGSTDVEPKSSGKPELAAGDFDTAFAGAPVMVDAHYATPPNHQNPLELFQVTCDWSGDELTVWESTQNVRGAQHGIAAQLGISPRKVRVISPYIGGAFGSRGELGQHTALVALAAKRLGRPVKLVASRAQCFDLRTFRAETRHHVRLAADWEGRLLALSHESWELTSRTEQFALAGSDQTARLYACPNIRTKVHAVAADRQTPGFMRAPPETPYLFALECAMDELAAALGIDPLDLRRRNDTMRNPVDNLPYTSRSLLQCIDAGAAAFGWDARTPQPGSMRDGDELVGYGYASAFYPAQIAPADARVTLTADGHAIVEVGTHEIGTGIQTVVAQVASDRLGVPMEAIEVRTGDSALPAAPLSAGSNSTASVCTVVAMACEKLHRRVARRAVLDRSSVLHRADPDGVRLRDGKAAVGTKAEPLAVAIRRVAPDGVLVVKATNNPHGAPPLVGPSKVRQGNVVHKGGSALKDRMQFAFGAQFVEVRVDRATGQIRVPRMVGAFAAGRIMNRRTAHAQLTGGQLWGLSSALHEVTEIDRRSARYMNASLGEYHIPVNADIGQVDAIMVDERDDQVNPLGIKGVGELGTTGANAAVANAIAHATGVRVRELPIRIEDVLASEFL